MKTLIKTAAITVAVLFVLGVVLTTTDLFFGSSKIRPLFGMSAEALAGDVDGGLITRTGTLHPTADAGL
jgi:hypothetical protein